MFDNLPRRAIGLLINSLNMDRQRAENRVSETQLIILKHTQAMSYLSPPEVSRRRQEMMEAEKELLQHQEDVKQLTDMVKEAEDIYYVKPQRKSA